MNSIETLRLQALKLKELHSNGSDFSDQFVEKLIAQNPDQDPPLRNICAFISPSLFSEVEGLCSTLSITKRRVVEMALIDIIAKANEVMKEVNPLGEVA